MEKEEAGLGWVGLGWFDRRTESTTRSKTKRCLVFEERERLRGEAKFDNSSFFFFSLFLFCVNYFWAHLKKSVCPKDAQCGGFATGTHRGAQFVIIGSLSHVDFSLFK